MSPAQAAMVLRKLETLEGEIRDLKASARAASAELTLLSRRARALGEENSRLVGRVAGQDRMITQMVRRG